MKKQAKRILSLLLVIAMLIPTGMMSVTSSAETKVPCLVLNIDKGGYVSDLKIHINFKYSIISGTCQIYTIKNSVIPDNTTINIDFYNIPVSFTGTSYEILKQIDFNELINKSTLYVECAENITYTCKLGYAVPNADKLSFDSTRYPSGYNSGPDKYHFGNAEAKCVIEPAIYQTVFGTVKGLTIYANRDKKIAHGVCYGMAATTAALLQNRHAINSFIVASDSGEDTNAENIYMLEKESWSTLFNMSLIEFIKYGFVYQFAVEDEDKARNGDLKGLYEAVKSNVDGNGEYVVINLFVKSYAGLGKKNWHTVLAVGLKETSSEYIILINDSNCYYGLTELIIKKDFSSWEYTVEDETFDDDEPYSYSSSDSVISYNQPGNVVYHLGLIAGTRNRTATSYINEDKLLIASTSPVVSNKDISEIYVTNGEVESSEDEGYLYWLDKNNNDIEITAENDASEITVSDVNSSVGVVLNSDERARFCVNDDGETKVSYFSNKPDSGNIVFTSLDENGEITKLTLTGTSDGTEVTATETDSGVQVTGLNDITVLYETVEGTDEKTVSVNDGATVNITINNDKTVESDWVCSHTDANYDGKCDMCSENMIKLCSHLCHNDNAFMQFIWKLINFFSKIFGANEYCECGMKHW